MSCRTTGAQALYVSSSCIHATRIPWNGPRAQKWRQCSNDIKDVRSVRSVSRAHTVYIVHRLRLTWAVKHKGINGRRGVCRDQETAIAE